MTKLMYLGQKKILVKKLVFFISITFTMASAYADTTSEMAEIKNHLENGKTPIMVKNIQPSPIQGLYEVYSTNGNIFYVDKGVMHLIVGGGIIDGITKKNLTAERFKELTSIKFDSLPLKDAIEVKKGNGAYKFAVFSDPDCPYCKRLEQGLDKSGITDYTAYIFLFPLKELHPDAAAKAESIWCAKDKKVAWLNWMVQESAPEQATCANPITNNEKLARQLGVNATPTIYLQDGSQTQDPRELARAITSKK
jgi:thiol:disulfide interchange protein DsbC